MALFAISYDLHWRRDYVPLWNALSSWGAVKVLESLWLLNINSNVAEIRDALLGLVDHDDSILVIELQPGSAWGSARAKEPGVTWLQNNLRRY